MPFDLHRRSRDLLTRLSALLPSSCALCGRGGDDVLCRGCHAHYFDRRQQRCRRCAIAVGETAGAEVCGDCLKSAPAFDATIVAVDYAAPVDQLVLALKFGQRLALAPLCARLLDDALRQQPGAPALPDILTAVPLGPQRLAQRGFNQALEIARPLSRRLGVELVPYLSVRLRDTQAQAQLPPQQRQQNLRHAFMMESTAMERIVGRHIGVVDDVMTTGSTLGELARTLKRFGAARVTNFVFARTPPH